MDHDLDRLIDRRHSDSLKWHYYPEDVLPMWVADMDFPSPEPVIQALCARAAHGVFGYGIDLPELRQILVERLARLYGWHVTPNMLVFVPGVVTGFNVACRAMTLPGDGVLIQTPSIRPSCAPRAWRAWPATR